ncbi:MAG: sulfatase-like hydrolase/transferase [Planctomycetaceae bacterium]|nr:sulfatase-like hydrolase/transferase [Planctomycetaceae bacterium]MCB9952060.1 sulfatase-like hydrolase/transferase [Planctomycetaceae bacterium]
MSFESCSYRQLIWGLLVVLSSGLQSEHVRGETPARRPNIVVIFSDDQGTHDVGCYGSEIPTPHIDTLARDGVKMTQFYAASSICTPSRFGLLTGQNPSRSQDQLLSALMFLADEDKTRGIRDHETTIAEVLTDAGYRTALIGKWHLGHGDPLFAPHEHGFGLTYGHTAGCIDFFTLCYGNTPDWYRNGKPLVEFGYSTDLIADEAIRYLNAQTPDQPFFLYIPFNAPHFGKGWNDGDDTTVNLLQPRPQELERVQWIEDITRRKYAAMVVALDDSIGRILDTLEANKLSDNTLVVFMSDHGGDPNYGGDNRPLRGSKATLYEGGIRVPCLVRWPGQIPAGELRTQPATALDWFPTFCSLANADASENTTDGMNLTPLLTRNEASGPREFFWETGAHSELQRGNWQALRVGEWKWVRSPNEGESLFNLHDDPNEQHDLSHTHPQQMKQMQARADQLATEYRASAHKKRPASRK